jgi:RNA polymerase sigma-70 factor (ECF subfamily)
MSTQNTLALTNLIEKIVSNDCDAFEEFFYKFQPSIFNFLYRFTFDYDISKDLCQDTFIKFWQKRNDIDTSNSPKAYLYKIAHNLAINYLERHPKTSTVDNPNEDIEDLYNNPEKEIDYKFMQKDIQKAILHLPERCRVIFMLSRFHDFTYNEIAETLDISIQTVKNQMNKSLAVLRKELHNYLY